jgi:hypothetical protein
MLVGATLTPMGKTQKKRGQNMNEFYRVEMFENSRGSFTVLKINTVTNTVTDFAEFADKRSATAFYFHQLEGKAIQL